MNSHQQQVRRRSNGTIDLDFYREQALTERAAAMTAFFRVVAKTARPAIAFALIIGMVAAAAQIQPPAGETASSAGVALAGR